jgi:hypothetical protein
MPTVTDSHGPASFRLEYVGFLLLCGLLGCGGIASSADGGAQGEDVPDGSATGDQDSGSAPGVFAPCTPSSTENEEQSVRETLLDRVPCFSGSVSFGSEPPPVPSYHLETVGVQVALCPAEKNDDEKKALEEAASEALAGVDTSCLYTDLGRPPHYVTVHGNAQQQSNDLKDLLYPDCALWWHNAFPIILDDSGVAIGMGQLGGAPVPQELEDCILGALAGKSFSCFSNRQLCPTHTVPH